MYLHASFEYSGKKSNHPEPDTYDVMNDALSRLETLLDQAGIKHKLAWLWTDGSLYLYLEGNLLSETWKKVSMALLDSEIRCIEMHEASADSNPFKCGCDTLKDYMEKE